MPIWNATSCADAFDWTKRRQFAAFLFHFPMRFRLCRKGFPICVAPSADGDPACCFSSLATWKTSFQRRLIDANARNLFRDVINFDLKAGELLSFLQILIEPRVAFKCKTKTRLVLGVFLSFRTQSVWKTKIIYKRRLINHIYLASWSLALSVNWASNSRENRGMTHSPAKRANKFQI